MDTEELVVKANRSRVWLALVRAAGGVLIVGGLMWYQGFAPYAVGATMLAFGGYLLFVLQPMIDLLFDPIALRLDSSGVHDSTGYIGWFPWSDIRETRTRRGKFDAEYVDFVVTAPRAIIKRLPLTRRWLAKANLRREGCLSFPTRVLEIGPVELNAEVQRRLEVYRGKAV